MAYATIDDVILQSGTTLDEETLSLLLGKAERRVDAALAEASLTGTAGDLDLETASVHYTVAAIIDRSRLTNERTNSLNLGGDLTIGNNTQNEIDYHESLAREAVGRYVSRRRGSRVSVRRVNG